MSTENESMEVVQDDLTKQKELEMSVANGINLAIQVRSLFELYSYRILGAEKFTEDMEEIVKEYVDRSIEIGKYGV